VVQRAEDHEPNSLLSLTLSSTAEEREIASQVDSLSGIDSLSGRNQLALKRSIWYWVFFRRD
jgi:hypothetical protein